MRANQLFLTDYMKILAVILLLTAVNAMAQDFGGRSPYSIDSLSFIRPFETLEKARKARRNNKIENALSYYLQAVEEFNVIYDRAFAFNDWDKAITALIEKAEVERRISEDNTPYKTLDLARSILEEHIESSDFLWFRWYYTRAKTAHNRNDFYVSIDYADSAQVFYNKSTQYDSASFKMLLEYKFYGYLYSKKSVDTLQKYIDIRVEMEKKEQLRNPDPQNMLYFLEDYPQIYDTKGEYDLELAYAISNFKYASQYSSDIVDPENLGSVYYFLAQALYRKGYNSKAIDVINSYMELPDSRRYKAAVHNMINISGLVYNELNQPEKAIEYFKKYLSPEFQEQLDDLPSTNVPLVLLNMGINYYELGETEIAKSKYVESLELMKSLVKFPNKSLIDTYRYLGDFYSAENSWNEALINYDSALRNTDINYNAPILSFPKEDTISRYSLQTLNVLKKKSKALLNTESIALKKRLLAVIDYVNGTHEKLMTNRDELYKSDGKLFLSQFFKELYETGIMACYQLYELTGDKQFAWKALNFAQSSKSNLFLEQEREYKDLTSSKIPYELKKSYYDANISLEKIKTEMFNALNNEVISDSVMKINDQILEFELKVEALKDSIVSNYLSEGSSSKKKSSIENLKENQLLIEFFSGAKDIFVIAVNSEKKIDFKRTNFDQSFRKHLEVFLDIVSNPPKLTEMESEFLKFREYSFEIFQRLIEPILIDSSNFEQEMIIVPDEFLTRIPFESLIINRSGKNFKELNYLVKKYKVRYLIASTTHNEKPQINRQSKKILGVGYSASKDKNNENSLGYLPGTEREIRHLEARFEGDYFLGKQGTRNKFLTQAGNYDIIHLAIHGKADNSNRFQSSLIFNGADSLLYPNQLYLANLNARLTVLSACESGRGLIESGEGTFSIARGFAIVGVPNIIMSLWEVNDNITSSQMVQFYDLLLSEKLDLNESLRTMKLNFLAENDSYNSHPFFWASFIHLGQNDTFSNQEGWLNVSKILFGLLALLAFTLIALKRKKEGES